MAALDAEVLHAALCVTHAAHLDRVETFAEIDSTNAYLKSQPAPLTGKAHIAVADHQTAGRGRQQNRWYSEPGRSLCLSLAYRFERVPDNLPALTLAHGVAAANALAGLGAEKIALKWPNDILVRVAKLGGILTETLYRDADNVTVVTGIGINLLPPAAIDGAVNLGWAGAIANLETATGDAPDYEEVTVRVASALLETFVQFDAHGFAPYRQAYEGLDGLRGRSVIVDLPEGEVAGIAAGIDEQGALLVDVDGKTERVINGSIRRIGDVVAAA